MDRELARELVTRWPRSTVRSHSVTSSRTEARLAGWTGPLRAPLRPPARCRPGASGWFRRSRSVQDLLPGVDVSRRGFGRTVLHLRTVAADGGFRMRLKVADRPDVMPEMLAAALDTAFAVRRRFGRMASGVHTISIDDGAGGFDDHTTAGSTQRHRHLLPRHQPRVRRRDRPTGSAAVAGGGCRRRCPARGSRSTASSRTSTGTTSTPRWRRRRRCTSSSTAPSVWSSASRRSSTRCAGVSRRARVARRFRRIVAEVSPYATTNMREATAELFKLWWCASPQSPPAPLVAWFGALLDRFYPPR